MGSSKKKDSLAVSSNSDFFNFLVLGHVFHNKYFSNYYLETEAMNPRNSISLYSTREGLYIHIETQC